MHKVFSTPNSSYRCFSHIHYMTHCARSESEIQVADAVQQSPQVVHTNGAHNAESQEQRRRRTLTKRASMIG